MAAGQLPKPGTKFGPCKGTCQHRDCEFTRLQAAAVCRICQTPIGYERLFYVVGSPLELAHAVCLEEQAEAERAAATRIAEARP